MTFQEKKKLSTMINNLPSEHLGEVVKIIHERMPNLCGDGEEIEIDIDLLNTETLRSLERFVKQVYNKGKKRKRGKEGEEGEGEDEEEEDDDEAATARQIEEVEKKIEGTHGKSESGC